MIRTEAPPRPVRVGAALVGIAGMLATSGCASSPTTAAAPEHADGTYTAEGSYATPETVEAITVTVTLQDDVITAVEVVGDPQRPETEEYQGRFIGGIAEAVVGKDIDAISVSRVAGSSLTSGGFNDAIETIKGEAAA
jgi:uncharacterized protein with FMN-binding domain